MRNVDKEYKVYQKGFAAGKKHSEPSPETTKFMEESKEVNVRQEERMNNIEHHIEITNEELGQVKTDITSIKISVAEIKTDVSWLKNNHKVVLTASLSSFFSVIAGLILFFLTTARWIS